MTAPNAAHAAAAGLNTNCNGGSYRNGVPYQVQKKLEVVDKYQELSQDGGTYPSYREVAQAVHVSHTFVKKVMDEFNSDTGILDPALNKPQRLKGPGARSLDSYDVAYLIVLLRQDPTRSLNSYRRELFHATGTITSTSTISRFWKNGFDTSATFRKPNMVPIDKYKPENIERAVEYIHTILALDPRRLKFTDEKSLKGAEIFNRRVRRDPLTGEVAPIVTDPDFRNTYTIIGLWCRHLDGSVLFQHQSVHE